MADTVREFVLEMVELAESAYESNANKAFKRAHEGVPNQVYLSPELFSRLQREEKISGPQDQMTLDGLVIKNQLHPEVDMDLTVEVHGFAPVGYNPIPCGLNPSNS